MAESDAAHLLAATSGRESYLVSCHNPDVCWHEQLFGAGDPAYELYHAPPVVSLVRKLTDLYTISDLQCWTSCYAAGEYIDPHRDSGGTVQLLICLQSPGSMVSGGALCIAGRELFLAQGDAVVFVATELEHCTTPADGARTVLVGRYYMS